MVGEKPSDHQFLYFAPMKTSLHSIKFILISLLVGYVSMLLQSDSMVTWYPFLVKSPLTPPGKVFAYVWTALYIIMGVSAGLVRGKRRPYYWVVILLFFIQLSVNLLWSFTFFYMQLPLLALIVLIVLFLAAAAYVVACYGQRPLAAYLNIPYLLWLLFAAYLNGYVVMFN